MKKEFPGTRDNLFEEFAEVFKSSWEGLKVSGMNQ